MSIRDPYPLIERVLKEGKQRLAAGDRDLISDLMAAYQEARHSIAAELTLLEQQIRWSIDNHAHELTEAWVRRQAWYQHLEESIQRESERLEAGLRRDTIAARQLGIGEAQTTWQATVRATPFMREVNVPAMNRWTASIQPGSPLDKVLRNYGETATKQLRDSITQGIIEGKGRQAIVRDIVAGESMPEYNAIRIVRTEMMRTYRGVYRDQVDALKPGMVAGYRWISALDLRTCPVCIGLHGRVFRDYPDFFHVQCRCTVAPVFSSRYAPPRDYQSGESWLRQQDEEAQRRILGSDRRFEVWRDGTPLNRMVRVSHDPAWGGSSHLVPLRDLKSTG